MGWRPASRHRRWERATGVAVLLSLAAVVVACAGEEDPAPAAAATSSHPAPSPVSESPADPLQSPRCLRAEHQMARDIRGGMYRAHAQMPMERSQGSERARETVRAALDKISAKLARACGGAQPAAFAEFVAAVEQPISASDFADRQWGRVLAAWLAWGVAVDSPAAARAMVQERELCPEFVRNVEVSYRTIWNWSATGKTWNVVVSYDNRTDKILDGSMGGHAQVTGYLEPDDNHGGREAGPGGYDATLTWGGSSADIIELHPGPSTELVAPDADADVSTSADGTLRVTDFDVVLGPRRSLYSCSVPVEAAD